MNSLGTDQLFSYAKSGKRPGSVHDYLDEEDSGYTGHVESSIRTMMRDKQVQLAEQLAADDYMDYALVIGLVVIAIVGLVAFKGLKEESGSLIV